MSELTPNLGLALTPADDQTKTFKAFRDELAGNGQNSNMMILDTEIGELKARDSLAVVFSKTQPQDQEEGDIWNMII